MKKKSHLTCFFILLSLLPALQNSAIAQIGNPGLIYHAAFNNAMFLNTKMAIERGMHSRTANAKADSHVHTSNSVSPANLDFSPSPQVHAKVVQSVAKIMANGDDNKIKAGTDLLNNGNLLGEFDKLLRQYGFNSHNLADVFSAYVILSWQAATGNEATKSPRGIEIFRKKMQASLSNNDGVRKFTNTQKQETAETIAYISTLVTLANQELIKKSDAKAITQSHQNIRQLTFKITGMDVTKYSLDQTGFNSAN